MALAHLSRASILFQPQSSFHLFFAFFCPPPSLPHFPNLSLPVSAACLCQRSPRSLYMSADAARTKDYNPYKGNLVTSWSRMQQKAGAHDNQHLLSLSLPLPLLHKRAHSRLLGKQGASGGEMWAQCGPTCSAVRLIAVINVRWRRWETKACRKLSSHEPGERHTRVF